MAMHWMTLEQAEGEAERWSKKYKAIYTVIEATEETMSHRFFAKIDGQEMLSYKLGVNAVVRNIFYPYYYPK